MQKPNGFIDVLPRVKVMLANPSLEKPMETAIDYVMAAYPNILVFDRVYSLTEPLPREAMEGL